MLALMLDFETAALTAATSDGFLTSFADLQPAVASALDIDHYATDKAIVWLVGIEDDGTCRSSTVQLVRDDRDAWVAGNSNFESWDGWIDLARDRPEESWSDWGPILGLGFEGGYGQPGSAYYAVRGIAAGQVIGIEFGRGRYSRRRGIDSSTGAFVVAVPRPELDESTILKATFRGGGVINLNP
jgi:hypothetical protein